MSNPSMPNLPGFGAIAETMELVRNMWGGMSAPGIGIPGIVMPTLSVEEINKQISDLKAVESWLTLNMNMLRGSIQALEVQSATISTLKSMGETFSASVKSAAPSSAAASPSPGFSFPFGAAATAPPERVAPAPAPWSPPPAAPVSPVPERKSPESGPASSVTSESGDASTDKPAQKSPAANDTGLGAPLANPAAWWNMLQNQFKHAVGTALSTGDSAAQSSGATSADDKGGSAGARNAVKASGGAKKPAAKNTKKSASKTVSKAPTKTASRQVRKSTAG